MVSVTAVLTDEATMEIKKKLQSRDYYVDINNNMFFSNASDVSELVIASLTD